MVQFTGAGAPGEPFDALQETRVLVDGDSCLLELVRYIGPAWSPVPLESSHRACLGLEALPWLTTDRLPAQFGEQVDKAREVAGRLAGP